MVPKYPFTVLIEYQARVKRPSVAKAHETIASAMMVYNDNIGRQDVRRITISLIIEQSERSEQALGQLFNSNNNGVRGTR